MTLQEFEMLRLTKKSCLVGSDCIDHRGAFFALSRVYDVLVVLVERGDPQGPKPARKAATEQRGLGVAQPNSAFFIDQALEFCEQRGSDREARRLWGRIGVFEPSF